MAIHNEPVRWDPTRGLTYAESPLWPTRAVSSGRALTADDNGCILDCTATLTLNVPAGLPQNFQCRVLTLAANTTSISFTGTTGNGAGTTLVRAGATQLWVDIIGRSVANAFVVTGA
jgi:hypothetical protein